MSFINDPIRDWGRWRGGGGREEWQMPQAQTWKVPKFRPNFFSSKNEKARSIKNFSEIEINSELWSPWADLKVGPLFVNLSALSSHCQTESPKSPLSYRQKQSFSEFSSPKTFLVQTSPLGDLLSVVSRILYLILFDTFSYSGDCYGQKSFLIVMS